MSKALRQPKQSDPKAICPAYEVTFFFQGKLFMGTTGSGAGTVSTLLQIHSQNNIVKFLRI